MNIKTGFFLLVLGILIVPILFAVIIMPILFDSAGATKSNHEFFTRNGIEQLLTKPVSRKYPAGSNNVPLFVMINDEIIIKSNVAGINEGTGIDNRLFEEFLIKSAQPDSVQFIRHIPGIAEMVIISFPYSFEDVFSGTAGLIRTIPALIFLSLILFTTIVSLIILRIMSRKFRLLEKATKEISNGNLDYNIEIPGSDNFTTLAHAFNKMRISLKEEKDRENRFIMGISHDLKTPLTLIGGYAEALADDMGQTREERENYLTIINRKLRDLEIKIDTLIDYRKMETGEWKNSLSEVPLRELLEEVCSLIQEDSEFMTVKFSSEISIPSDYRPRIDPGLFSRAVDNIISNSLRHTPEGGRIDVSAYIRQARAVVEISDTGAGIPPEELNKVTEPFFRGSKSRRESGFGLGLSIVKSIADTHGWVLNINSEPGGGTRIIISGI